MVGYVWGWPGEFPLMVIALLTMGIVCFVFLKGIQIRGFRHALQVVRGKFDDPNEPGQISHFQALTTALSATVGLGNIAGVAVAISLGGPGAVFWMIVVGFLGMGLKFAECSLGVMYRKIESDGTVRGGAMYYIERGLGKSWRPMGIFFAVACICASFGAANMFQTNQVASILHTNFAISKLFTGIVLAVLVGVVIIGGIQRIGQVTSRLVPFMGGIYVVGALYVVIVNYDLIPQIIGQVLDGAFSSHTPAVGGFAGATFRAVLVNGVRRACFSNEAGLGSAPIAHSAVATKEPIREGIVALLEPFIDTIVICSMTAFAILAAGTWSQGLGGVEMTAAAFNHAIPGFGTYFVPLAVFLFAYSTLLSWAYYGETATHYIVGKPGIIVYKIFFCIFAVVGALWKLGPVLDFSDLMLGLMVVPNLIAVILLFPKLKVETEKYFKRLNEGKFNN